MIIIPLLFFTTLFIFLNFFNDDDESKKLKISKYLDSLEFLDEKNLIDESLIIILKLYKAELSRNTSARWLDVVNFKNLDNYTKILSKLVELNYVISIDNEKSCYIITYDGISLIELNSILFLNTKKLKLLLIIRIFLSIKLSIKTSLTNESIKVIKLAKSII